MDMSVVERRQIENQMIFRRANEKLGIGLDKIDAMHREDGNPGLVRTDDMVLDYKCECSDEDCDDRISIPLSAYQKIHLNRDTFIIKLKHQVDPIEKVLITEANYSIVKNNKSTTEPGEKLNKTSISNT